MSRCSEGFEELKAKVLEYPPERAAEICRVQRRPYPPRGSPSRRGKTLRMLVYTLGITEHTCGMNNVLSVANLQMLLGNVGIECGGVNPLRGQNNVQGACDMGALPNVFPGYQGVADPQGARKVQGGLGSGLSCPTKPGLMMPQMIDGLASGKVKAFYCLR